MQLVFGEKSWDRIEKELLQKWGDQGKAKQTLNTYKSILAQLKKTVPKLDIQTFVKSAIVFCQEKTSKCKLQQAKTVATAVGFLLGISKDTMRDALKVKIKPDKKAQLNREGYDDDELDLYASQIKWCPYLVSAMLFQLTCGGRTQDLYDVEAKSFLEALKTSQPY